MVWCAIFLLPNGDFFCAPKEKIKECSPIFKSMLTSSDFLALEDDERLIIDLSKFVIDQLVIESDDHAVTLGVFASKYLVHSLVEFISKYMVDHLTTANMRKFEDFAVTHTLAGLHDAIKNFKKQMK